MFALARRALHARSSLVLGTACALLGVVGEARAQEASPTRASDEPVVSLAELLAYAEQHAPPVRLAEGRRGYADATRAGARPLLRENPAIEVGVGPRWNDASDRDFDYVVGLGQPIEIAGERRRRLAAAGRERERRDAQAMATRWEIRRDVVLAYAAAVVERERVATLEEMSDFVDAMLRVARVRLETGDATAIDLRVAEADAARAREARIRAEAALRAARIHLAEVTGWAIESPPNVPRGLEVPRAVPALAALMEAAEAGHPELRARRAAVEEAEARAALADREAFPNPVLGVQVEREGATGGPANHIVLGTLGLPLPLFQRNEGERARARVDEEVARVEESAATRALRARIARAHAELVAASERVALFASTIAPELEESLSMLERGFEAGELPLLTVAVARERFLEVKRDSLEAYADYYRALAELEFAAGVELGRAGATAAPGGAR